MSRGWIVSALALASLAGCRKAEQITKYTVSRLPEVEQKRPAMPPFAKKAKGPTRLLGAIVSDAATMWFIRLNGPEPVITGLEAEFNAFVESLRFPGGKKPIAWTLPGGWTEHAGDGAFRYATLRTPGGQEVVISPQDRKNESMLTENLERWATTFAGLSRFGEEDVPKVTRTINVEGRKVILVDMKNDAPGGGHDPHAGHAPLPFHADLPAGWKGLGLSKGALIIFRSGFVDAYPLDRDGTSWPEVFADLARKEKLDLPSPEQILAAQKPVEVEGKALSGVEFRVEHKESPSLFYGVQLRDADKTWVFILRCDPADDLAARKAEFLSLLRSVRFKAKG